MKLIITGATGLIGSGVLKQALHDDAIDSVTVVLRRKPAYKHEKLTVILHNDFNDWSDLKQIIRDNDAMIWCLGISQTEVGKEEYIYITYDYTLAAANEILLENTSMTFLFVSGEGADQDEKSRYLFGRIKGKTEKALFALPIKNMYVVRPGGVSPEKYKNVWSLKKKLLFGVIRLMQTFMPDKVISTKQLAKVLLYIIIQKPAQQLWRNREMKALLETI